MIVASLLLILVAVTLLVLGLSAGSSSLLISSIVASLLAAVALVVGARHASAARRTATVTDGDDLGRMRPAAARRADLGEGSFLAPQDYPEDAAPRPEEFDEADRRAAYAAGDRDAEAHLTGSESTQRVPSGPGGYDDSVLYDDSVRYDDPVPGRASSGQEAGPAGTESPSRAEVPPLIHSEDSSRPRSDDSPAPVAEAQPRTVDDGPASGDSPASGGGGPVFDGGGRRDHAEVVNMAEEFDEPDPEDPPDEPLPQAVTPAAAVQVARLDAEVFVVDSRPRYHLSDCAYLAGRRAEKGQPVAEAVGLPVNEAVELGFSPCGLCRPVDRLVATATTQ